MLPRLRGWGESLSRQAGGRVAGGGGIGTRGPGETKLETDRRRLRARIGKLKREIAGMSTGREVQRRQRRRREVPAVVIAGYTNAGKSSLLNALTGAGVLVEDALFATLDPAVRRAQTPSGRWFTLTDTVGFVRHLPHQLVEAFRSTLEESADADLILHVVDGSDAGARGADRRGPRRARPRSARPRCPSSSWSTRSTPADPVVLQGLRAREPGSLSVSRPRRARACRPWPRRSRRPCPGLTCRSGSWSPTAAATW
jgi:GTP-binding protein HflX